MANKIDFLQLLAFIGDEAIGAELECIGAVPPPTDKHVLAFLRVKHGFEREGFSPEEWEAGRVELMGRMLRRTLLEARNPSPEAEAEGTEDPTKAGDGDAKVFAFHPAAPSPEYRQRHPAWSARAPAIGNRHGDVRRRSGSMILQGGPWKAAKLRAAAVRPLSGPSALEGKEAALDQLIAGTLLRTSLDWARGPLRILAFYDENGLRSVRVDVGLNKQFAGCGVLTILLYDEAGAVERFDLAPHSSACVVEGPSLQGSLNSFEAAVLDGGSDGLAALIPGGRS